MAGFHIVHDIYIELVKYGCELKELYEYSVKELLFMLKYKREGLAESWWSQGLANRAAYHSKTYPSKPKDLFEYLYEKSSKQKPVPIPDWLKDDYQEKLNASVKKNID